MALILAGDYLSYCDYDCYRERFNWRIQGSSDRNIIYHCFWVGKMTRHHELNLKSLFISQSMPFEVWVWMPPDTMLMNRDFLSSISVPQLKIKTYFPHEEAAGTPFMAHVNILTTGGHALISDAFRTLVLFKYGGVYFDMDILFLKDIRPLCSVEFFYQWANHAYGNSALIHFVAGSENIDVLVARSIKIGTCHPARLYSLAKLSQLMREVYLFPIFTFDPAWLAQDRHIPDNPHCNRFNDFFRNLTLIKLAQFFPSSYAYHWHNRWREPIKRGTIVGQLYGEVTNRFSQMFGQIQMPALPT